MRIAVLDDYESRASTLADWDRLGDRVHVTFFPERIGSVERLVEALGDFDGVVLTRERTAMPGEAIRRLPNLKLIVTTGMGNASLDMEAASAAGIRVCGTSTLGHPTAELAWGLIIGLLRRIPEANRMLRGGVWKPLLGEDLRGRTLALLGLGRIGSRMARVALAFEMNVVAWSQNLTEAKARDLGVEYVERDELFRRADILSIHVGPERYRDAIGAAEFSLMKPGAILINTSRAPIVNEQALLDALRRGRIAGAGIDVYSPEPPAPESELLALGNVLATPHLGYVTRDNLGESYRQVVECVEAFLDGAPVRQLN